jgi:phosphoenolpyruvate carboxykinase (GTP)
MCERIDGKVEAQETPIGLLPKDGDLDVDGLEVSNDDFQELFKIDTEAWKTEIPDIENHFSKFGDRLPERLKKQLDEFRNRLG